MLDMCVCFFWTGIVVVIGQSSIPPSKHFPLGRCSLLWNTELCSESSQKRCGVSTAASAASARPLRASATVDRPVDRRMHGESDGMGIRRSQVLRKKLMDFEGAGHRAMSETGHGAMSGRRAETVRLVGA